MKKGHFERSRFSKVMSWKAFQQLDAKVQAMPSSLPEEAKLTTGGRFTARKPTGLLTQVVLFWMRQEGAYVYRQNNQGSVRKDRNGEFAFTPGSKYAKGQPDIQGIFQGKPVYIEIKSFATRDRMRPDQERFKAEVEKAGGEFWTITMLDDLLNHFEALDSEAIPARSPPK